MKDLYSHKKQLTAEENLVLSHRIRKGDLRARTKMIEGNTGFAYKKAIRFAHKNSGWSHVEDDDLLQASLMGLIEAVDRYDPTKMHSEPPRPYAFTTYAGWWILKRLNEEISNTHWNTMRPPREIMRAFLYDKMEPGQTGKYIKRYISEVSTELLLTNQNDTDQFSWSDIMMIVNKSELTKAERRVFDSLYGENPNQDDLSDLSKGQIVDVELSIMTKVRDCYGG